MRQAYCQGRLDGLCGVYSLINTRRLLWPRTSRADSVDLFYECLSWLEDRSMLAEVVANGMGVNTLVGMSREVIEANTPGMLRLRPYYRRAVDLDTYWAGIHDSLASGPTAMLICMESWDWSHWTVVSGAELHRLSLFDSSDRKSIFRHHCTVEEVSESTPTQLYPSLTMAYKRVD